MLTPDQGGQVQVVPGTLGAEERSTESESDELRGDYPKHHADKEAAASPKIVYLDEHGQKQEAA